MRNRFNFFVIIETKCTIYVYSFGLDCLMRAITLLLGKNLYLQSHLRNSNNSEQQFPPTQIRMGVRTVTRMCVARKSVRWLIVFSLSLKTSRASTYIMGSVSQLGLFYCCFFPFLTGCAAVGCPLPQMQTSTGLSHELCRSHRCLSGPASGCRALIPAWTPHKNDRPLFLRGK